jgi:hypothetical protein
MGSGGTGTARLTTLGSARWDAGTSVRDVGIAGRELPGGIPGVVQICTEPSWLPVANMNGSGAGFQAMHVMSPPKAGARIWCR